VTEKKKGEKQVEGRGGGKSKNMNGRRKIGKKEGEKWLKNLIT